MSLLLTLILSDECAFCDNAFQFFFDGECILC